MTEHPIEYRKIMALVRTNLLEKVETRLQEIPVKGLSVSRVKGYGEYANFFNRHWLCEHVRIEIFAHADKIDKIVDAIMEVASTGLAGDGIVAVLPVEKVYRIRNKALAQANEL